MKILTYALAACAAVTMFTSCSSDEPAVAANGDGTVTFKVQLPQELASRAISDGTKARNLWVVAYDTQTGRHVDEFNASFQGTNMETTVTLQLMNGRDYNIMFWAFNSASTSKDAADKATIPYYYDVENGTITVNYDKLKTNDDNMDVFYNHRFLHVTANAIDFNITLRRPLAQVNIGTDDLNSKAVQNEFGSTATGGAYTPGLNNLTTVLKTTAPNALDVRTGLPVANSSVAVTMTAAPNAVMENGIAQPFPCQDPTNKEFWTGYDGSLQYLGMYYLLADSSQVLLPNMTIEFQNAGATIPDATIEIPNVPVQYNWMTNIYGSLLTSKVNVAVTKAPAYYGANNIATWDGTYKKPTNNWTKTVAGVTYGNVISGDTIFVYTPDVLAYVIKYVNTTDNFGEIAWNNTSFPRTMTGKIIKLMNNMDFQYKPFVKFGTPEHVFNGTFDYNGKYLYNLAVIPNPWYLFASLGQEAQIMNGEENLMQKAEADQGRVHNATK